MEELEVFSAAVRKVVEIAMEAMKDEDLAMAGRLSRWKRSSMILEMR